MLQDVATINLIHTLFFTADKNMTEYCFDRIIVFLFGGTQVEQKIEY